MFHKLKNPAFPYIQYLIFIYKIISQAVDFGNYFIIQRFI